MSKKSKQIGNIILWIVVILLGIGAVGILIHVIRYTDRSTGEFKSFCVTYGDETILSPMYELTLERGSTETFGVKYTFDTAISEPHDYHVSVVANEDADFEFTAGELTYHWRTEKYFDEYFGLKKEEQGFSLTIPENASIRNALESRYPGRAISVPAPEDLPTLDLYTINVSSYDGAVQYVIRFSIPDSELRLEVDRSDYIF